MPIVGSTRELDLLREVARDAFPLPALSGERYAATHAAYEAASDQRELLQRWVARELPPLLRGCDPVRVVGVGVGDGSIDAPLAAALAVDGRQVHYTGVEPHAPSAVGFAGRLVALRADALTPTVVIGDFADHDAGHPADLVHFVHSLYYVPDLSDALDHALTMLTPGGLLMTAVAPLEPLCVLTELLCPWDGRTPWFARDVRAELDARGLDVHAETLVGRLDVRDVLLDPRGRGEAVLDFLVGARSASMPAAVRDQVLRYLGDIVIPGTAGIVPHPLDITIVRVPRADGPTARR